MVFLRLYSAHRCSISKQTTPVPSTSLPNNYSLNTLRCADRATGSVVKKNRHIYMYRELEDSEDLAASA
jgi:hypothetical protein